MPTVIENLWQHMLSYVEYFTCNEPNLTFPHSGLSFLITSNLFFVFVFVCVWRTKWTCNFFPCWWEY